MKLERGEGEPEVGLGKEEMGQPRAAAMIEAWEGSTCMGTTLNHNLWTCVSMFKATL